MAPTWLNSYVCFQKAGNPTMYFDEGYTIGYCVGNIIILVSSAVILSLVVFLLVL